MGRIPISQNVSMALQVEGKVKAKAQRWESTLFVQETVLLEPKVLGKQVTQERPQKEARIRSRRAQLKHMIYFLDLFSPCKQ